MTDQQTKPTYLGAPTYLGDGLYAEHDGYQFRLYASDGVHETNEVFLDDRTFAAFIRYATQIGILTPNPPGA